jgi:ABC-type nitrate/sulfonate/bicarbonate transport system ATPase subunit
LLLDEPFINLDVNAQKKLLNLTIKLWNKTKQTLILVSHDIDFVYSLSQHVFMLSNKPIKVLTHMQIKSNLTKRKSYSKEYIEFKKQFLDIARTW